MRDLICVVISYLLAGFHTTYCLFGIWRLTFWAILYNVTARIGAKCKPLLNYQKIVLNRIKAYIYGGPKTDTKIYFGITSVIQHRF